MQQYFCWLYLLRQHENYVKQSNLHMVTTCSFTPCNTQLWATQSKLYGVVVFTRVTQPHSSDARVIEIWVFLTSVLRLNCITKWSGKSDWSQVNFKMNESAYSSGTKNQAYFLHRSSFYCCIDMITMDST